jgi:hypothetical protein
VERVTDGHSMAQLAHWMLLLLFVSIEVLPVLSKLLSSLGSPPLYDRLASRQDEDVEDAARLASDTQRHVVAAGESARLTVAQNQADAQIESGRQATQALVDKQTKIALRAIHVWGELAALRADEELDKWYHRHIGGRTVNGHHRTGTTNQHSGTGHSWSHGHAGSPSASEMTVPIQRMAGL